MRGFLFLLLLCCGSLFGVAGLRHLLLSPPLTAASWITFAAHAAPVLLLLPGLLQAGPAANKTLFIIVAMVGMWYFVLGVVFVSGGSGRWLGFVEVALSLLLIAIACMAASRLPTPPKR